MTDFKFELGIEAKDEVSGFKGIIEARSEWQTGCNTYGIESQKLKDGLPMELQWFDEMRLKKVSNGLNIEKKETGGPQQIPQRNLKGK